MVAAASEPTSVSQPAIAAILPSKPRPDPLFDGAELFSGIAAWPDLDDIFRHHSFELLDQHGTHEWQIRGGTLAGDGHPTLGGVNSVEAAQVVADVIGQGRRFRFSDGTGRQWAAIVDTDDPSRANRWMATAVGCDFDLGLLSQPVRIKQRDLLRQQVAAAEAPGQRLTRALLRQRLRLSRFRNWLLRLDTGIALLTHVFDSAYYHQPTVEVDARAAGNYLWGSDGVTWPGEWQAVIFDGFAALAGIHVQRLRLTKTGWSPEAVWRRPAVSMLGWKNRFAGKLEVHFAPEFVRFVSHWLWPSSAKDPQAADLSEYPRMPRREPFDVS